MTRLSSRTCDHSPRHFRRAKSREQPDGNVGPQFEFGCSTTARRNEIVCSTVKMAGGLRRTCGSSGCRAPFVRRSHFWCARHCQQKCQQSCIQRVRFCSEKVRLINDSIRENMLRMSHFRRPNPTSGANTKARKTGAQLVHAHRAITISAVCAGAPARQNDLLD